MFTFENGMSYAGNAAGRDGHLHLKSIPAKNRYDFAKQEQFIGRDIIRIGEEFRRAFYPGAATGFRNAPTLLIATSTTSPAASGPTPEGVPVATTSPGKSVITCEIH